MRVESPRLEWIEALIDGDAAFTERFGIAVIEGWAVDSPKLSLTWSTPPAATTPTRGDPDLFSGDDDALVGFGGFKGPPIGGEVEIGYAIAPERQGRGLATTATRTLIDRARDRGATLVVAHTLATPNASTAVLVHCGFTRTATIADPEGGVLDDVWRWELQLRGPQQTTRPPSCSLVSGSTRTGRVFHRWADIATIIGMLDSQQSAICQRRRQDCARVVRASDWFRGATLV